MDGSQNLQHIEGRAQKAKARCLQFRFAFFLSVALYEFAFSQHVAAVIEPLAASAATLVLELYLVFLGFTLDIEMNY